MSSRKYIMGHNQIDYLCDELLTEILIRLPTYKSVIQCMCVCKRWTSIASHPCFILKFVTLKLAYCYNGGIKSRNEVNSTFVKQYALDTVSRLNKGLNNFFRTSIFNPHDESSFSCLGLEIAYVSAKGFASCNDLLLYWKRDNFKYNFSIMNVQTKKRVSLPSLPCHFLQENRAGFICDAFFSYEKEVVINASFHYSVVVVDCTKSTPSTKLNAHIFSSHCGSQWCDRILSLKRTCQLQPIPSSEYCFCFDGKLHFSCLEGFFGFDHNSIKSNDEIQCHFIEWPLGMLLEYRVCISQENLYLSDYCCDSSTLHVWILEDYREGNWLLKHRVETREWVSRDSWMAKNVKEYSCEHVLGFNPSSDVIYVVVPECVFLCNLVTKVVEWVCDTPIEKRRNINLDHFYSIPLIYQIMPTPLPCVANGLKDGVDEPTVSG